MDPQQHARPAFWKTPFGIIITILAVVASVYLYVAHKDHVLTLLPFAFLAACPLVHVFMQRGHGHRGHSPGGSLTSDEPGRG